MDFNEYQEKARETAIYPDIGNNLWYPALGLGESGECQNTIKKIYRDKGGVVSPEDKIAIIKELGDQLWYIAAVASELRESLDSVARLNLAKLVKRKVDGKLHGSGGNR